MTRFPEIKLQKKLNFKTLILDTNLNCCNCQVIKNAMQATVNHNDLDDLPSINVLVCQSDNDITIKISDLGGGVDRVTSEKMWKYLYTTAPRASLTSEAAALSGLGYGLPLSRLYAR